MKKKSNSSAPKEMRPSLCAKDPLGFLLYKSAMRMKSLLDIGLKPHGLVSMEFGILNRLKNRGPMSQVDLGREMQVDKASMVKFLDHLEKAGLLKRESDSQDRRVKLLKMSPQGAQVLKKAFVIRDQIEQEFLSVLATDEVKQLTVIMKKLMDSQSC